MADRTPTGSKELDTLLGGGYEKDIVTTIYGPGGSGKTNFCLLCAVAVARSKKVIYIDTESSFSIERLKQIAPDYEKLVDNILVLKPATFDEQKKVFSDLRKTVDERIGLIIVDTVVMLYRLQRGRSETYALSRELGLQTSYLSEIASKKHIPVLATSQVYSGMNGSVKMVGGDLLKYSSKCIIELENLDGLHRLTIKKHRSMPLASTQYRIIKEGVAIPR